MLVRRLVRDEEAAGAGRVQTDTLGPTASLARNPFPPLDPRVADAELRAAMDRAAGRLRATLERFGEPEPTGIPQAERRMPRGTLIAQRYKVLDHVFTSIDPPPPSFSPSSPRISHPARLRHPWGGVRVRVGRRLGERVRGCVRLRLHVFHARPVCGGGGPHSGGSGGGGRTAGQNRPNLAVWRCAQGGLGRTLGSGATCARTRSPSPSRSTGACGG
jgi:hypothetical protein